jgi:hypothetical protein
LAKNLLYELGSGLVQNLHHRDAWYLVGQKGIKGFTPIEEVCLSFSNIPCQSQNSVSSYFKNSRFHMQAQTLPIRPHLIDDFVYLKQVNFIDHFFF